MTACTTCSAAPYQKRSGLRSNDSSFYIITESDRLCCIFLEFNFFILCKVVNVLPELINENVPMMVSTNALLSNQKQMCDYCVLTVTINLFLVFQVYH